MKTIFHIDVNNAFLSWEAVKRLSLGSTFDLRAIPSAVGGSEESRNGIILAKSTPAKAYGIKTGETLREAFEKCPSIIIAKPDFYIYRWYSKRFYNTLLNFSDKIERYSIDECFLDYTGMEEIFGEPLEGAYYISDYIKKNLGFTVNIGIGENKILAKMAGELEKPDKINTIWDYEIKDKLWPLPIEELFMAGRQSVKRLKTLGIYTIGDLANYDLEILKKHFKSFANVLYNNANGIGSDLVAGFEYTREVKSIGNSTTTPFNIKDYEDAYTVILGLSEMVSKRLREASLLAGGVTLSLKTEDFRVYSHTMVLNSPLDCTDGIFFNACELFNTMWDKKPIRHIGVRAERLSEYGYVQLSLFERDWSKNSKADRAIDKIRYRFGDDSVMRGALIKSPLKIRDRGSLKIDNSII